jgi:hypothetical protein
MDPRRARQLLARRINGTWENIRAAAGIADGRLHDLRHSFELPGIEVGREPRHMGAASPQPAIEVAAIKVSPGAGRPAPRRSAGPPVVQDGCLPAS